MGETRLQHAERNFHESAARVAWAESAWRALASELATVDSQYRAATWETTSPAEFAQLSARRELLARSVPGVRAELDRLTAVHRAIKQTYEQTRRTYERAEAELTRAERFGDTGSMTAARRVIDSLHEER